MKIKKVHAREVLKSRGNPTVEAELTINNANCEKAIVPSVQLKKEIIELLDGVEERLYGKV